MSPTALKPAVHEGKNHFFDYYDDHYLPITEL